MALEPIQDRGVPGHARRGARRGRPGRGAGGVEGREQRVAVFGDGDFVSNSFIANGGNLELGMNLVNWLGADDAYINVPTSTAPDLKLNLSQTSQLAIALGFLVVLPLGLLASGITLWWRRRKR